MAEIAAATEHYVDEPHVIGECKMERKSENVEPSGLSEAEVASRLQQHGYNELPSSKGRSILATAWDVVREPMFLLLLACGTIYLILGDVQEAVMLLGFVFVVLGITLYQERKTERASKPCVTFPALVRW